MRSPENYLEAAERESESKKSDPHKQIEKFLEFKQAIGFITGLKKSEVTIHLQLGDIEELFQPAFQYVDRSGERAYSTSKPTPRRFNQWLKLKKLWVLDGPCRLDVYGCNRHSVYLFDSVRRDPKLRTFMGLR